MYKECKERVAVGGRNIQRQQGKKSELSSKEGCDKWLPEVDLNGRRQLKATRRD